jgi:hypothetical protein
MEISYQNYVNKVVPMALTANYPQQLNFIQSSPKFKNGQAQEFPGYTIITPPAKEDIFNREINQSLTELQEQFKAQLNADFFVAVPPESFHITIADLIWDTEYINAVTENNNFDNLLIEELNQVFTESQKEIADVDSLDLEVLGISIFPRAIVACFIPTEQSYNLLVKLRQLIYQNEHIIKLGIEQQYEFVGHVTLGYFGDIPEDLDTEQIAKTITSLNNNWIRNELPLFHIKQWELRKFNDMQTYIYQSGWPRITLNQ